MRLSLLLPSLALSLLAPTVTPAQSPAIDDVAIRSIVQGQADAWNAGDAEAFAAHYADTGTFTNVIVMHSYGRQAFVAQHQRIFATIYKGSHNTFNISKTTYLRPDVALVEIDGILTGAQELPPGLKAGPDGALRVKLLEVMTREQGSWSVAAFHNVAVYLLPAAPPAK